MDQKTNYFSYFVDKNISYVDCISKSKEILLKAKKKLFQNEICFEECPNECDSIQHKVSMLSVSEYPSKFYEKILIKNEFLTKKYADENFDFKNTILAGNENNKLNEILKYIINF